MGSRWVGPCRDYRLVVGLTVGAALGLAGAWSNAGTLQAAPVKIKGVRWVDGVKEKVRCSAGHILGLEPDRRTVTLAAGDPKCPIAADAPALVFEGTEDVVVRRGKAQRQRTLVGSETQSAEITGVVSSLLSLARDGTPKRDRGTIAYLIDDGGPTVVFLGTYTASKF